MLNSLARNKGSRRWLGLCLFAIAFLFAALVSGCGGSGSSGSGGGAPAKEYSDVIFHFNNLASETLARAVPDGTTQIRFTGSTSSREVLYGPTTRAYAPTITLEKVPVKVTGFVLECLNNNGGLTAIIPVSVQLNGYRETVVEINDYKELKDVISKVVVSPTAINDLLVGYSESITAIATLTDGQIVDLTPYLTFTSSNSDVATVEQNGYDGAKVTASKGGETVISGSVLGVTTPEIKVVVNGGVAETSVGFEPKELEVAPNIKSQSKAFVYFNNNTKKNLDSSKVTYTVEPEGIVTVKASTSGPAICEVTGVSSAQIGATATITMTATLSDGSTSTSTMKVTIIESVPLSLTISNDTTGADWPTALGENRIYSSNKYSASQFKAMVTMSNGDEKDVTSEVTWVSGSEEVAKFDDETAGKLQAVGVVGNANVTATYNNIDSNEISMEVITPGVEKLEVINLTNLESGIILALENGQSLSEPYALTLKATYGNGDEEYPTMEGGLVAEHLIYTDTKSEDYLTFEDGTTAGVVNVYGKRLTGVDVADESWMKFTYKEVSTDKIPVKVIADKLKFMTVNFVDQTTGKSYGAEKISNTWELAVPYGRSYTISIHGESSTGKDMGEISGSYSYAYSVGNWDQFDTIDLQDKDNLSDVASVDAGSPVIVSGIDTNEDSPTYKWSDTPEVVSLDRGYTPSLFSAGDTRGAHKYNYTDTTTGATCSGEIIVVAKEKSSGEEAFRVKLYFAEPAVDSYLAYSYGAHSRRSDDLTFDIPRGTNFKLGTTQHVIAVMSDLDDEGNHRTEDISGIMSVDDSSVKMDNTFILEKVADNEFSTVDSQEKYEPQNSFALAASTSKMEGIVINNAWDEEGVFGQEVYPGGDWASYNCENTGFIFRLERPLINKAILKVLDIDEQEVTPDDKGKYHFKQDEKFYCYYADVETSDHQETYKDLEYLASVSEILGYYIDGKIVKVLEHVGPGDQKIAVNTDPYHMLVSGTVDPDTGKEIVLKDGYSSSITIVPDADNYYDASAYNTSRNIVLDMP